MNRRFRLLAALMALVAFSAFLAESALAVFCAPASGQHSEVAATPSEGHDCCPGGVRSTAHEMPTGGSHGSPGDHSPEPSSGSHQSQCPLAMGMACSAVSLPAYVAVLQGAPASAEHEFVPQQVNARLLLVHTLYHPPRA